jgi:hypothetical protein
MFKKCFWVILKFLFFFLQNAVITHVENITASHLNMSIEEFDKYCKGLTNSNQGIKIIQTNLKILAELKDKQELLKKEAFKLQNDMNAFNECMKIKVLNCFKQNDQKYLSNIKEINEWFKKNYKYKDCFDEDDNEGDEDENESVLNETVNDSTQPLIPIIVGESYKEINNEPVEVEKVSDNQEQQVPDDGHHIEENNNNSKDGIQSEEH